MLDQADWMESFESEADRESYQRWLDGLEAEEVYQSMREEKLERMMESSVANGA